MLLIFEWLAIVPCLPVTQLCSFCEMQSIGSLDISAELFSPSTFPSLTLLMLSLATKWIQITTLNLRQHTEFGIIAF